MKGMIHLKETTTILARCFRDGKPVSSIAQATFSKVTPKLPIKVENLSNGINYAYYEGDWDSLPNFGALKSIKEGTLPNFSFSPRKEVEHFGFEYKAYIKIPNNGVYTFFTASDDGSQLYIGDELVVNNDGLHGTTEKKGAIALASGLHPIRVTFFEKTGGDELKVAYKGPGIEKQVIPDSMLLK
jgi:alpha-L-fucosidase